MKHLSRILASAALIVLAQNLYGAIPAAPTQLTAKNETYYSPEVRLSWRAADDVAGTLSYEIFRSDVDSLHFVMVATTTFDDYRDFQIAGTTTYYYYVKSVAFHDSTHDESPASAIVSVTTLANVDDGHHGGLRRGTVTGQVTDSLTGAPLANVVVTFYRISSPGVPLERIITGGGGNYHANVDTGAYFVSAQPQPMTGVWGVSYLDKWYKNAPDAQTATVIVVTSASTQSANFALARKAPPMPAMLRGTVRDSSGTPVAGARIAIMRSVQKMETESARNDDKPENEQEKVELDGFGHGNGVVWKGMSDSLGTYSANLFAGDSYTVLARKDGFMPQFFDHKSDPLTANRIALAGDTSGIDFNLIPVAPSAKYTVGGSVQDSSAMRIVSRVVMIPLRHQSTSASTVFGFTDSLGNFAIKNVRAGKYFLLAVPFSKYAPAYYKAGQFGVAKWQMADTVTVSSDTTGFVIGVVRFSVSGFAKLHGKVHSSSKPESGSNVFAVADDGSIEGYGLTDDQGEFEIEGVSSGHVTVSADQESFNASTASVTIPLGGTAVTGLDLALSSSVTTGVAVSPVAPAEYRLMQNYPNPFNPSTRIAFSLPAASVVKLQVFNILGQEVATLVDGATAAGVHEMTWNGRDNSGATVASGAYFYKLSAAPAAGGASFTSIKRMMLIK